MTAAPTIILIPPTHEQSVFSFHVEKPQAEAFLGFLQARGIKPWRPPTPLDKTAPDGEEVVQVEFESSLPQSSLEELASEFEGGR